MTFKRFMVTSTTGFDKKTASQLANQKEDAISRTKTSERSEAILEFTNITVQEHAAIFIEAKTILQDHHGKINNFYLFWVYNESLSLGQWFYLGIPVSPSSKK